VSGVDLQQVKTSPGNWVAPAGSYRSGGGGNETIGAFETDGSLWRFSEPTGRNSQRTLSRPRKVQCGRRPCTNMGKAAAAGYRETVGIGCPTSDQGPAGHRGNDGGMSVNAEETAEETGTRLVFRRRKPRRKPGRAEETGTRLVFRRLRGVTNSILRWKPPRGRRRNQRYVFTRGSG
jgi:hypothetical protein